MQRSLSNRLKLATVATTCMFVWTFVLPHPALAREVVVPPQTPVKVATTSTIQPSTVKPGDQINMQVSDDVKVDGVVVIKSGARVLARVTQAKERGMIGIAAEIGVVLESVEAVDGTMIPISGSVTQEGADKMVLSIGLALICCLLFALMKGGEAQIPAGTTIMANTTMKAAISL